MQAPEVPCLAIRPCLHISTEGGTTDQEAMLVHEASIELYLNDRLIMKNQCMARDLDKMAVGFFVCEGLIQHREELLKVKVDTDGARVEVHANLPPERLQGTPLLPRLASGGSKTGVIDFIKRRVAEGFRISSDTSISAAAAVQLGSTFNHHQGLYRETKFVHSAALSDGVRILYHAEDVGRHNAVDKVVGFGFLSGIDFSRTMLLCSGRFSLEMVSKAARVGIPIYISPAAPSIEAVELADQIGMCLVGRVRENGALVYSAQDRVKR